MKNYIAANKSVLFQFSNNMTNLAPLLAMEGSTSFMTASVKAGVALALREVSRASCTTLQSICLILFALRSCIRA